MPGTATMATATAVRSKGSRLDSWSWRPSLEVVGSADGAIALHVSRWPAVVLDATGALQLILPGDCIALQPIELTRTIHVSHDAGTQCVGGAWTSCRACEASGRRYRGARFLATTARNDVTGASSQSRHA